MLIGHHIVMKHTKNRSTKTHKTRILHYDHLLYTTICTKNNKNKGILLTEAYNALDI